MSFELSIMWGIHAILTLVIIGALIALSRSNYRSKLVFRFSFGRAQSFFRFRLWPELSFESIESAESPAASSERSVAS